MNELNERELDAVTGGTEDNPAPMPTGGVTYRCPDCTHTISASTRDTTVTCPKCKRKYAVKNGQLVPKP